jgi:hypothetical protein
MQDKFVLEINKYKLNGFFLEIGSGKPIKGSNTYVLEKNYNWKGIMVDKKDYTADYKRERNNSTYILDDATKINYNNILKDNKSPYNIDYLQIDLEVGDNSTLNTLQLLDKQVMQNYKFTAITFEHDIFVSFNNNFDIKTPGIVDPLYVNSYRYILTRQLSRKIFKKYGYYMIFGDVSRNEWGPFEDWYIHPDNVDMSYIRELQEKNKNKYTRMNNIEVIDGNSIMY